MPLYQFRKQSDQIDPSAAPPFPEWVRRVHVEKDPRFFLPTYIEDRTQSWWLQDESGELIVDYVAHLETIAEDWAHICARIGVRVDLPHLNRSKRASYRTYYDAESREIIRKRYAEDIENFGYEC